ncbi:asparagine--tRNA ligase [candidate division KSB1 bacterium 4572_119]|nr:MAG: asparagine--tRNA ligase [candidate division KSB1 bacterium 4572_119]
MKNEIYIEDIGQFKDKEATVSGWLYNRRSSGKIHFLMLRDGTGIIQAVAGKNDINEDTFEKCKELPQESSLKVTGLVVEDKRAPGGYELQVKKIEFIQMSEDYPITPKDHGTTFLMDHRHLWLRSSKQHAIMRIRHSIIRACRDYYDTRGYVLIDAPIFTPAACEGTSTLFETDYFGSKAYLTQSGQLYMEAAAMAFGKVYCFGPTFRAEKSKTRRHLTEFWMIEPEIAYCDLDGNMDIAEEFIEFIVQRVLEERKEELKILERDTSKLEKVIRPFPRISYDEAVKMLKDGGLEFEYGNDFGSPDETYISDQFDRPVMVHRYPAAVKAFYMKADQEDPTKAMCVDVLAPEGYGEVIGGGQREDNLDILLGKIKEHQLPMEAFDWYLDIRKYGSVPHSGFGMGIERAVAWICGLKHIRETIPFPRTISRIQP